MLRSDHSCHHCVVLATAFSASTGSGGGSCEGYQVSTKGTRSPAATSNSATVLRSSPRVGTGVLSRSASGPATARSSPPSVRVTHGTTEP